MVVGEVVYADVGRVGDDSDTKKKYNKPIVGFMVGLDGLLISDVCSLPEIFGAG